jgi:hypothetical protein
MQRSLVLLLPFTLTVSVHAQDLSSTGASDQTSPSTSVSPAEREAWEIARDQGDFYAAIGHISDALQAPGGAADAGAERARLHEAEAMLSHVADDGQVAQLAAEDAVRLRRQLGEPGPLAFALLVQAEVSYALGPFPGSGDNHAVLDGVRAARGILGQVDGEEGADLDLAAMELEAAAYMGLELYPDAAAVARKILKHAAADELAKAVAQRTLARAAQEMGEDPGLTPEDWEKIDAAIAGAYTEGGQPGLVLIGSTAVLHPAFRVRAREVLGEDYGAAEISADWEELRP